MRRAARIDENQPEIIHALRKAGAAVTPLHRVGGGVSDLLVSWRQRWFLLEVKNPLKPKADQDLTPGQKRWVGAQHAPVHIVYSAEEAVGLLSIVVPQ